jgi:LAS superfamily LD-carboxypeptidase LdcB
MALPVSDYVRMPASLAGQSNGKIAADRLVDTPGQAGGPTVRMCRPAYRAWRAMEAAARSAGHILKTTSFYDSYRPFSVQDSIFRTRYRIVGWDSGLWYDGNWWVIKAGYAVAAVPGTSNHGWALALDLGEEKDGDTGTESIDSGTVDWLVRNAERFGFSAELQSEPWHWRYYEGDQIPQAVLDYEEGEVAGYGFATQEQANDVWRRTGSMQRMLAEDIIPRLEALKLQAAEIQAACARIEAAIAALEPGSGGGSLPAFPWTVTFNGDGEISSGNGTSG